MKKILKDSYLLMCFVLCGLLLIGNIAKADTVIKSEPETPKNDQTATTEQPTTADQNQGDTVTNGWNDDKTSYYVNGKRVKGVKLIDGQLYYFNTDGTLYTKKGMRTIDGKTYYFTKKHTMKTGIIKVKKQYYYFQKKNGERYEKEGVNKVDGKYYYFTDTYTLKSGWYRNSKNKRYYFDKDNFNALTGWNYVDKYKYFFNKKGQLQQDVRKKLTKKQKSSYLIRVNRTASCVTVYAKDGLRGYTIPVVAFVSSAGKETPIGTFKIRDKLRWHELMGPSWGQWCEHLTFDILFHSVYYDRERDNRSLNVSAYNKLGTMASHGCIRLTAGDAKWIYDNCKIGTKVIIYNNKKNPGPFDKPKAAKLSSRHTWDPTDPAFK